MISFVLTALFGISTANAGDLPDWISGKALFDHYERVDTPDQSLPGTLQENLSLYIVADPKLTDTVSSRVEVLGTAFRRSLEHPDVSSARGDVKEANLSYRGAGWDLRLGQNLTVWGRSDIVNPTNFLSARDYTYFSSHDEFQRLGAPGARASFVPNSGNSPLELTFAWNARYPQTKMLLPNQSVPAGLSVETDPNTPKLFDGNQEFAAKIAYLTPSWDVSLSVFDGRSHFGQFVWNGAVVTQQFLPIRALGADFSKTFDDFVIRAETAYYFYDVGKAGLGGLSLTEPDHWETVVGIEKPIGQRFRVLAQLLYRLHPDLQDSQTYVGSSPTETALVRAIASANALIQNYQHRSKLGGTFLVSYDSEDTNWRAEVEGIGNFVGSDYFIRPLLSRKLGEALRLAAGFDYYGGPIDQPLGALRNYRNVFLEGAYSF